MAVDLICRGGWSLMIEATEDIQKICDIVKDEAEAKTGKKYDLFKAVEYKSKTMLGYKYIIKVQVGDEVFVNLRVYWGNCLKECDYRLDCVW